MEVSNIFGFILNLLYICFFYGIGALFILNVIFFREDITLNSCVFCIICAVLFFITDNDTSKRTSIYTKTHNTNIVSIIPQTKLSGDITGGFIYFSGIVDEQPIYRLREKLSENRYKDFNISAENVILEESKNLTTTGTYIVNYECYTPTITFKIFNYVILYSVNDIMCDESERILKVPFGTINKQISNF